AVRDVGRVLGYSYSYCDQMAKLIPMFTSLREALDTVEDLKKAYREDPEAQRLLDMAKKVEGLARHSSTHACAVLITDKPLNNYTPLQYASGDDKTVISQYSMNPVEDLGLLKMDFLGLKNLTILEQAIKIIHATKDVKIDLDNLPLEDKKTFELFQEGSTTGVFQFESGGMKRYLKQLKPTELEDIIAMVSLYRPGPMEFIPDFIGGKHGTKKVTYLHPKLEPILKNTYGIAIYQEQIMRIARDLAGFTYGQADVLRKAVGKKIQKLLDEQEEVIIGGMVKNGIDKKTAGKIWEFIIPFARYGFNRSHAACYAMIAYQTAYLKSNYPEEFMAALLTADQDNIDRVTIEVNECRKMNIEVLQPDVNESFSTFSVVEKKEKDQMGKIRFGLNAIKNVGHNIAQVIIEERKKDGPYKSLENFLTRIKNKDLNKKSLESLVKSGAFDSLITRGQALGNIEKILEYNKKIQNDHKSGQDNLFAGLPMAEISFSLKLDEFKDIAEETKLSWEKQLLGLYLSSHPFKKHIRILKNIVPLNRLKGKEGENIKVAGVITNIHKIITHKGKAMLFVVIEDSISSAEVIVFPKMLETTFGLWQDENKISIFGKVSNKDGQPKILVERAELITQDTINNLEAKKEEQKKLWLVLPSGFDKKQMEELKSILETSRGLTPVYLEIHNGTIRKIKTKIKILPTPELQEKITEFLSPQAWQLKAG
ncbi:DNA polymerase III subunit alpha, partial [Candidatus Parcubacteria bacterium]|nr:DNA polymerase III subunit alpha [Candidatus Parcubacteria bacterium]